MRPAAVPIGKPVNELERYYTKENRKIADHYIEGAF